MANDEIDAETMARIEKGVDEFMANWKRVEIEWNAQLAKRRAARRAAKLKQQMTAGDADPSDVDGTFARQEERR